MRVLIGYHFFAHYRRAVMERLAADPDLRVTFLGDVRDVDGSVKGWDIPPSCRFIQTKCYYVGPLMLQPGLLWHVLTRRYDHVVLLGNAAWPMTWLGAIVSRLKGQRTSFWTHGWIRFDTGKTRLVRKTFYGLAHNLLLYGHVAKCIGASMGFKPERMHVIYNSLDYHEQVAAREQVSAADIDAIRRESFGERAALPMLICSTRLIALRRLDLLLDALALLKGRGIDLNLLLVGDGVMKNELDAQAKRLGLSVRFYGACYDEAVLSKLTMASDLTVAPGKVGLTAMQSLGYGTPVLTHDDFSDQMPEWEALVPGKTGCFFKRNDVASLADALADWFRAAPPREAVRQACYEMIERFWNAENQHRIIRRALDGHEADDLQAALPTDRQSVLRPAPRSHPESRTP